MREFGVGDPLPAEDDVECTGFRDKDGNATVGFCLWCNKDFYSMEEVWEHNDNDMEACPEVQRLDEAKRARTGGRAWEARGRAAAMRSTLRGRPRFFRYHGAPVYAYRADRRNAKIDNYLRGNLRA